MFGGGKVPPPVRKRPRGAGARPRPVPRSLGSPLSRLSTSGSGSKGTKRRKHASTFSVEPEPSPSWNLFSRVGGALWSAGAWLGGLVYSPQVKKRRGVQPGTTRGPYRKRGNAAAAGAGSASAACEEEEVQRTKISEAIRAAERLDFSSRTPSTRPKSGTGSSDATTDQKLRAVGMAKAAGARVRVVERRKAAAAVAAAAADAL